MSTPWRDRFVYSKANICIYKRKSRTKVTAGDGSILYMVEHYASKTIKTAKDTTGWMPVTWRVGNRPRTTDTVLR